MTAAYEIAVSPRDLFGGWYRITYHDAEPASAALPVVKVRHNAERDTHIALGIFESEPLFWLNRIHGPISELTLRIRDRQETARAPNITLRRIGWVELFVRALFKRPVTLFTAFSARVTGRAQLARQLLSNLFKAPFPDSDEQYRIWRRINECPLQRADIADDVKDWARRPRISVLIQAGRPAASQFHAATNAILRQSYPEFEVIVSLPTDADDDIVGIAKDRAAAENNFRIVTVDDSSDGALATAFDTADGEYVMLVGDSDVLADEALYRIAKTVAEAAVPPVIVYGDSDRLDEKDRRFGPHFKPGPNRELLYAQDYVGRPCAFDTASVRNAGGFEQMSDVVADYALKLRLFEALPADSVRHIPLVLYHRRSAAEDHGRTESAEVRRRDILQHHLSRTEPGCRVTIGPFATLRVHRPLADPPPVSLIVPTRDQLKLTRQCLDGLLNRTDYPDLEILLVNNDSRDAATFEWFTEIGRDQRVSVVDWPGAFNYSAINNDAVARASGSVVGLINNDIEIVEGGWLREMVSLAIRPEIGAVGARLLYPDRRVQHAGIILGVGGVAGHGHKFRDAAAGGYERRLQSTQFVSAVTAACLVVEKEKYLSVGGLDADNLAVAFNDVDFCLKLTERGLNNVYTPHATLIHHESASRGDDLHGDKARRFESEAEFMRRKWSIDERLDPYYSPNLSHAREDFSLDIGFLKPE